MSGLVASRRCRGWRAYGQRAVELIGRPAGHRVQALAGRVKRRGAQPGVGTRCRTPSQCPPSDRCCRCPVGAVGSRCGQRRPDYWRAGNPSLAVTAAVDRDRRLVAAGGGGASGDEKSRRDHDGVVRHDQDAAARAATAAHAEHAALRQDLLAELAGCFPRRESREACAQMVSGLLMELEDKNC